MTKAQRLENLMPGDIPRWIRCYDNGGETADRYTVVFSGRTAVEVAQDGSRWYPYLAMSESPYHPQGVGIHGSNPGQPCDTCREDRGYSWPPALGRKCHLGTRIGFKDLPPDCQEIVIQDYKEIWRL
jgi:hypothetical protein